MKPSQKCGIWAYRYVECHALECDVLVGGGGDGDVGELGYAEQE